MGSEYVCFHMRGLSMLLSCVFLISISMGDGVIGRSYLRFPCMKGSCTTSGGVTGSCGLYLRLSLQQLAIPLMEKDMTYPNSLQIHRREAVQQAKREARCPSCCSSRDYVPRCGDYVLSQSSFLSYAWWARSFHSFVGKSDSCPAIICLPVKYCYRRLATATA